MVAAVLVFVAAVGWSAAWLMDRRGALLLRLQIERLGGESRVKVERGDLPWWSSLTDKRYFDKVTEINLSQVEHYDFRKLTRFRDLESLILYASKVSDDNLAQVAMLPRLRSLNLHRNDFAGPELRHLAALPNLQELRIGPIKESVVPSLAGCNSLQVLRISLSPDFTDRGLSLLPPLPNLRTLYLYRTGTTEAGVHELQRRFPSLEIVVQGE